jgi:hypothetical protein
VKRSAAALARYAVLFAGIVATRESAPARAALPDLSGTWRLNREQSDDPRQMWRDAGGASEDESEAAPSAPSGGSRGRHAHGRSGGRADGGAPGLPVLEGRDRLTILHEEPRLWIEDGAGRERVVYTDGREQSEERSRGGTTKVEALWKDGHVVVSSSPERGPKVVETYAVTVDRSQLTVTTTVAGRRSVTFRSVYDAVREPPPTATPPAASDDEDDGVSAAAEGVR